MAELGEDFASVGADDRGRTVKPARCSRKLEKLALLLELPHTSGR
jgi:hypothetical protein